MNKLTTEQKGNVITVSRIFDAPRELVFDVHADCNHLVKWFGGDTWPLSKCEMDFREGGRWHYCFKMPEGNSCALAVFKKIKRPETIVYLEHFLDENGEINKEFPAGLLSYEFSETDGKTQIKSRWEYPSKEDMDMMLEMGAVDGLTEVWERLDKHLANIQ